jgi:hypothetical protein
MVPVIRNFVCPFTETTCTDGNCKQDQCAKIFDYEAKRQEIQHQQLNDPAYRKAAAQVLEARCEWLNSQGETGDAGGPISYISPSKAIWYVKKGLERDDVTKRLEAMIDKILQLPGYRSMVRAAVYGLPISPSSFVQDADLDKLFDAYEDVGDLDQVL